MLTCPQRIQLLACALLASGLTPACSTECPTGSQAGACDLSNTTPDPAPSVTKLSLSTGCDYVPTDVCAGDPGFACWVGGGDQHQYGYAVIADQQAMDKLSSSWSDVDTCMPKGIPTDWTDTFLLLARVRATSSTASSVSHTILRRADDTPIIKINFDMTFEKDCDCAEVATLGLLLSSPKMPAVCLDVESTCNY
jgi:hypothetical protein